MITSTRKHIRDYNEKTDREAVSQFLTKTLRTHTHLDWREPIEWMQRSPTKILYNDQEIQAILSMPPDPIHMHWVRFFVVKHELPQSNAWHELFSAILSENTYDENDHITALCYQNWMESMLVKEGWQKVQKVIVLTWGGNGRKISSVNTPVNIRRMQAVDLDQVIKIDNICFQKYWKFSAETITRAHASSAYATVAEIDGTVVGLLISTADLQRAHLTRLAVLPEYRNQGIGSQLVENMLRHFSVPWIRQITVNTQFNNHSSIHLYEKCGFEYRGESFPIYRYPTS